MLTCFDNIHVKEYNKNCFVVLCRLSLLLYETTSVFKNGDDPLECIFLDDIVSCAISAKKNEINYLTIKMDNNFIKSIKYTFTGNVNDLYKICNYIEIVKKNTFFIVDDFDGYLKSETPLPKVPLRTVETSLTRSTPINEISNEFNDNSNTPQPSKLCIDDFPLICADELNSETYDHKQFVETKKIQALPFSYDLDNLEEITNALLRWVYKVFNREFELKQLSSGHYLWVILSIYQKFEYLNTEEFTMDEKVTVITSLLEQLSETIDIREPIDAYSIVQNNNLEITKLLFYMFQATELTEVKTENETGFLALKDRILKQFPEIGESQIFNSPSAILCFVSKSKEREQNSSFVEDNTLIQMLDSYCKENKIPRCITTAKGLYCESALIIQLTYIILAQQN
ncbi:hypothetical protein QTN25_000387 [Entamoeba marina]